MEIAVLWFHAFIKSHESDIGISNHYSTKNIKFPQMSAIKIFYKF